MGIVQVSRMLPAHTLSSSLPCSWTHCVQLCTNLGQVIKWPHGGARQWLGHQPDHRIAQWSTEQASLPENGGPGPDWQEYDNKHPPGDAESGFLLLHPREHGTQDWLLLGRPHEWTWRGVDANKGKQASLPSRGLSVSCWFGVSPVSSSIFYAPFTLNDRFPLPKGLPLSLYTQMLPGVRNPSQNVMSFTAFC